MQAAQKQRACWDKEEPACWRSCRSVPNAALLGVIIQSCVTLVKDVPFLITDGQMTKGSETTQSEPTYGSERDQPESRKQRLSARILHVHLCLQPHALLQEQTGKTEACSGSPQTPLSLGKPQEVPSKCRSCWLQLVWSPLCLKLGHLRPGHPFFFIFIKVHFHPFIGCAVLGTGWALSQCQTAGL